MTGLLPLLQDFYRDKLGELLRHEAGARRIRQYDVNNTYQYIVNRDEVQLSWVGAAVRELGGTTDESAGEQARTGAAAVSGDAAARATLEEDARSAQAFVDRWRPRVDAMTNARHRGMLRVILGETLEQKRSFEQALAGRTDLLGRRDVEVGPAVGAVLPDRWIE
jgi:hypothetical protein